MFSTKSGAARLSLIVIASLVTFKLVVAAISGGISILAQGLDSLLDLAAVAITVVAVKVALKPADEDHPFGHGKAENIAGIGQAAMVFTAGGVVIFLAVRRLISGSTIELTGWGIIVMAVSVVASILLSLHLRRVARETDSVALEANARHIAVDVYSAAAVLGGLVAIRFTGLKILDPLIALGVAGFIMKTGYDISKKSVKQLIDTRLPQDEEDIIKACLLDGGYRMCDFHDLRTRKAGGQRFVELHLTMPRDASIREAYDVVDRLESCISARLPNTSISIRIEPCRGDCEECTATCTFRNNKG